MSTQPTEAQYQLAHIIRQSSTQESAAQLIADYEARAVEHAEKEAQGQRARVKAALIAIDGLNAALAAEREKVRVLRVAMVFIMKFGGMNIETELGEVLCNGSWCAEQARAALAATKEGSG